MLNVVEELTKMKQISKYVVKQMERMPEGSLRISRDKNGYDRYYHYIRDDNGELSDRYIPKRKEYQLIQALAQKEYYKKVKQAADSNIRILEKELEMGALQNISDIYNNLKSNRKSLIIPIEKMNEEKAKRWAVQSFATNPNHPERLIFKTDRGDMVRSKSECIIANILHQNEDFLVYRYEAQLKMKICKKIIYPDFTIMRKADGKIFYLEHAGMMDDFNYANKHVLKVNMYIKEGIYPGENLLITQETSDAPLDVEVVEDIIKHYFDRFGRK